MVYVTHDQVEAMTMSDRVAVFSAGALHQIDEPRRLYEEPRSLFVAQFLGENNAFVGTLAEGGTVTLAGGECVSATAVAPEGRITLVVRPEKILLGAAAAQCPNRFPARIAEISFLGDQLRLRLAALGSTDFIVKLANAADQPKLTAGASIEIGWRTEDCRALGA